jgi:hypothetical protein
MRAVAPLIFRLVAFMLAFERLRRPGATETVRSDLVHALPRLSHV